MGGNRKAKLMKLLSVLSLLTLFVGWQLIVDFEVVPNTLLASPTQVIKMFIYKLSNANPDGAVLSVHVITSLQEALTGYLLALVIGIPLGLAMGWFVVVEGLARPIFEMIRPIPPVAWIPLAIFWFGIGLAGKVFIIWASGLVPCVINSFVGVKMTNPVFIKMARTYGARTGKFLGISVFLQHYLWCLAGCRLPWQHPGLHWWLLS